MKGTQWLEADWYVRRHASEHAAEGNVLDPLVRDSGYLAVADPTRLLPALRTIREPDASRIASVYRRVSHQLVRATAPERMAMLHLTALQHSPPAAEVLRPLLEPRWQARWANWRTTVPSTVVDVPPERVSAAAVAQPPGSEPLLIVGVNGRLRCWGLLSLTELSSTKDIGGIPTTIAVTPGGRAIVVGTDDGWLGAFGLPGLDAAATRPDAHNGVVSDVNAFSTPSGILVGTCGYDGSVALWRFSDLDLVARRVRATEVTYSITPAAVDGETIIVSAGDAFPEGDRAQAMAPVTAWSVPGLEPLRTCHTERSFVHRVFEVPLRNGSVILTAALTSDWHCWDPHTGALTQVESEWRLPALTDTVLVEVDNDCARMLVAGGAGDGHEAGVLTVERRSGHLFATATPFIETDSTGSGSIETVRRAWTGPVTAAGRRFVVGTGADIRLWDIDDLLATIADAPTVPKDMGAARAASRITGVASGAGVVWSGSELGQLMVWAEDDGERVGVVHETGSEIVALGQTAESQRALIVAGHSSGVVRTFDAGTRLSVGTEIAVGDRLMSLALTRSLPDPLLATSVEDRSRTPSSYEVRLWRLLTGEEIITPRERIIPSLGRLTMSGSYKEKALWAVTFVESAESTLVALGGNVPMIKCWDVETFDHMFDLARPGSSSAQVISLASAETVHGPVVAAGTTGGAVQVWAIPSQTLLEEPDAHGGSVSLAFGLWGDAIALLSGGGDGRLRVWSTGSWQCELTIPIGAPIKAIAPVCTGDIVVATTRGLVSVTPHGSLDNR